ncbi:hypothetical protein ACFQ3Z_04180 [Streptomyces nogalater]
MVTPFIGVLMVEAVHLDVRMAGVLVAVATFIQFGGSILGGAVVDRLGLKRTMVFALTLRTAGLVLLGVAVQVPWVAYPAVVLVAAVRRCTSRRTRRTSSPASPTNCARCSSG